MALCRGSACGWPRHRRPSVATCCYVPTPRPTSTPRTMPRWSSSSKSPCASSWARRATSRSPHPTTSRWSNRFYGSCGMPDAIEVRELQPEEASDAHFERLTAFRAELRREGWPSDPPATVEETRRELLTSTTSFEHHLWEAYTGDT